jgi:NADPH-dependent curcumin reductase CurA|nr:NADP-dependent oxidoreductase [uncultured Pedobacter sp.]
MNKIILLNKRPTGKPVISDFKFTEEPQPSPKEGEVLLKTLYVSVDPYLRGRMSDEKSYIPPFQLNEPVQSSVIAEVTESKNSDFKVGDLVSGILAWKQFQTNNGKSLNKIDKQTDKPSAYLGILGMTGLTAYLGLIEIGKPKAGETLVVSGAAGAVGSVVGQIGKILGCRVVGIAGGDEKVNMLKNKFGFDAGIDYKNTADMQKAVKDATPNSVDIYFDNVGGEIADAVLANINKFGRVPVCGAISSYNATEVLTGPRLQSILIKNSVLMQGFIVGNYAEKFPEAIKQLSQWLKEGKLKYAETIVDGFDNIPQAFIDLFDGKNEGKMIVKV